MKAMCTGIRFWEEIATSSTAPSSRYFTVAWRLAEASWPSSAISRRASRSGSPEREIATAKAPRVA